MRGSDFILSKSDKSGKSLKSKNRIWELDFLKGLAFFIMVWDHIVYDLSAFFGVDTSVLGFFKDGIGEIAAIIFMTVCGISVTIGKRNLRHAAIVGAIACALTFFTLAFDKATNSDSAIIFGILHFLAVSMFVGHFAKRLPRCVLAVMAAAAFGIGKYFETLSVSVKFLFPFGLVYPTFYSSDYFPIFPNLAFTFIGIIIGKSVYVSKKSIFSFKTKDDFIGFVGRHTLLLYVVHQPIILGIMYAVDYIVKFS